MSLTEIQKYIKEINRDFLEIGACVFELKSYQCVFVDGLGPGQHPQPWPDLVQQVLADLQQTSSFRFTIPREFFEVHLVGVRVSNPFIELFALHDKVAIPRRHDAAPGRSKVNNHVQRCKVSQNQYFQTLQIDMLHT